MPGVTRQEPFHGVDASAAIAFRQIALGQLLKALHGYLVEFFLLGRYPSFKIGRVTHTEAGQKLTLVQVQRLLPGLRTHGRGRALGRA